MSLSPTINAYCLRGGGGFEKQVDGDGKIAFAKDNG